MPLVSTCVRDSLLSFSPSLSSLPNTYLLAPSAWMFHLTANMPHTGPSSHVPQLGHFLGCLNWKSGLGSRLFPVPPFSYSSSYEILSSPGYV